MLHVRQCGALRCPHAIILAPPTAHLHLCLISAPCQINLLTTAIRTVLLGRVLRGTPSHELDPCLVASHCAQRLTLLYCAQGNGCCDDAIFGIDCEEGATCSDGECKTFCGQLARSLLLVCT